MRHLIAGFIACVMLTSGAVAAAPTFPALTGRIVDSANILPAAAEQALAANLEAFEQKTKHQLVVVTLPSLQGYEIEEYGVQLGRHWGIGQKGKNDGALLIVAPNERAVRIEVGYGLEGDMTDAVSSRIIQGVILPEFKRGDMATGITNGARAIIGVLGGEPYALPTIVPQQGEELPTWLVILIICIVLFIRFRYGVGVLGAGTYGKGWSSGGGGGFSGGGGSFGGGGSSGKW